MLKAFFALLVMAALTVPALAQEEVLVDGLRNPRNLAYDAAGNLYIAEAGVAGPELTETDTAFGASARVSRLSPDGELDVVVTGLISYRSGDALGASAVLPTGDSLWFTLGETNDFRIPFTHALVEVDLETGRVLNFVDLLSIELEQDPDGNPNLQSNPTDFALTPDGTVLIANAGANALLSWTPETGVQVAVVWDFETDNAVPTSVEVADNGDIYVGFLTGFPFPEGGSRVEQWRDGQLIATYPGLTAVTGLAVTADGTVYATEHGVFAGGWQPGRVVEATPDGPVEILGGLNRPFGLALTPDGDLVVSNNSVGGADGQIIRIPLGE